MTKKAKEQKEMTQAEQTQAEMTQAEQTQAEMTQAEQTKESNMKKSKKAELVQYQTAVENVMKDIATTHTDVRNKIINGLQLAKKIDNITKETWYVKDVLEICVYKMDSEDIDEIELPMELLYATLHSQYILGINNFNINVNQYDRQEKFLVYSVEVETPYGRYREKLENFGLRFAEQTDEQKEKENQTKTDVINEVNSILSSFGLKSIDVN